MRIDSPFSPQHTMSLKSSLCMIVSFTKECGDHLTLHNLIIFIKPLCILIIMKSLSFAILENLNQLAHYPLLAYSSCVWTSSVVIDYLIINTPMIFPFSPNKQIQTKRL